MTRAEKINANPIFNQVFVDTMAWCNRSYEQAMSGKITFDEHVALTKEARIKMLQTLLDEQVIV
jgi:hypothetical protein